MASTFKAFLNLLPTIPVLLTLLTLSCGREEYEPSAEGIAYDGRRDGHLVFRAVAPETKAALPSGDTILSLTEGGRKTPFVLKAVTCGRPMAPEGTMPRTKPAYDPYGEDNLPGSFEFTVYSEDGVSRKIDSDQAVRSGDRWISRKDWSGKISSYTKAPTIHAWYNDDIYGAGYLELYDKNFECLLVNAASSLVGLDDLETPDHIWGYGVYSGLRADNSIVFRHVGAGVCVHCAQAVDMTVTELSIDARLEGIMNWTGGSGDISDVYSEEYHGVGVETLTRPMNVSLHGGDTWLVSRDEPVILPPQCGGREGADVTIHLNVTYNGVAHTLEADLSDIPFYSGSMTTLEVAMDSFLWIDAPDVTCVWDGVESLPASVSVATNISSADFVGRTVTFGSLYSGMAEDAADPTRFSFTPRWHNFTNTPWTEDYTVSCGTVSSTGSVVVEPGNDYGKLLAGLPSVLFIGTDYDIDTRFESLYTGRIYPYPPFLTEYDYESDYISVSSEGTVTPLDVTPSARTLTISGGLDGDVSYFAEDNLLTLRYEVAEPLLEVSPASLSFSASDALQTAVTGLPRELGTVISDGRKLWTVPAGDAAAFSTNASWPYYTSRTLWLEYYNPSSSVVSLSGSFTDTNGSYVSSIPFREGLDVPPGHGFMTGLGVSASGYVITSVSVSPSGGLLAVNILKGAYDKVITVSSRHPWEVSSRPDWVILSALSGGTVFVDASSVSVRVAVLPNGTGEARTGTVVLRSTDGTGLIRSVTVTQEAGPGAGGFGGGGYSGGDETEEGF